jgi:hypothetical protein
MIGKHGSSMRDDRSSHQHTVTTLTVDLDIDAEQLKRLYRGAARMVLARARDGRWVRFPAALLRGHVEHHGVHGAFALRVNGSRLEEMRRLN